MTISQRGNQTRVLPHNPDVQPHRMGYSVKHDDGKFIAWLLEEASVTWAQAQAPANRRVLEQMRKSDNPIVQNMTMWVEQAEYAHFPPYHPRWTPAYRALTQGMEAIAFRKADVRRTLREVTASANDILTQS